MFTSFGTLVLILLMYTVLPCSRPISIIPSLYTQESASLETTNTFDEGSVVPKGIVSLPLFIWGVFPSQIRSSVELDGKSTTSCNGYVRVTTTALSTNLFVIKD